MLSRLTDLFWSLSTIFVAAFLSEEDAAEIERETRQGLKAKRWVGLNDELCRELEREVQQEQGDRARG